MHKCKLSMIICFFVAFLVLVLHASMFLLFQDIVVFIWVVSVVLWTGFFSVFGLLFLNEYLNDIKEVEDE